MSDSWTAAETAMAVGMATDGHTSSQIAGALGTKTRNAVIGKLTRLGVRLGSRSQAEVPKSVATKRRKPGAQRSGPMIMERLKSRKLSLPEADALRVGVSFVDLKGHHCRWPFGEQNFVYCGRERYAGSSYCLDHDYNSRRKAGGDEENG